MNFLSDGKLEIVFMIESNPSLEYEVFTFSSAARHLCTPRLLQRKTAIKGATLSRLRLDLNVAAVLLD